MDRLLACLIEWRKKHDCNDTVVILWGDTAFTSLAAAQCDGARTATRVASKLRRSAVRIRPTCRRLRRAVGRSRGGFQRDGFGSQVVGPIMSNGFPVGANYQV